MTKKYSKSNLKVPLKLLKNTNSLNVNDELLKNMF